MKTPRAPFVDAQAMNRSHPSTFHVPDAGELSAVDVGDYVKVAAEGERFWVEVLSREGEAFTGRVNNDLVRTNLHGLADTDVVAFESRHVHAIERAAHLNSDEDEIPPPLPDDQCPPFPKLPTVGSF